MNINVMAHYDTFLAAVYSRTNGGMEEQIRKNRKFFSSHSITPQNNHAAIDIGAGSGFQSVPLVQLGYTVTAVDFCQPLLYDLRTHTGSLPIITVWSDIRTYSSWSGLHPALIVCMGDTLTHLTALLEAEELVRRCVSELDPGGWLVITIRDYSREPDGVAVLIPVLREEDRIFLCKLKYHTDRLTVQDILYTRSRGIGKRTAGEYMKIRISQKTLTRILTDAGFMIEYSAVDDGMITVIAGKAA